MVEVKLEVLSRRPQAFEMEKIAQRYCGGPVLDLNASNFNSASFIQLSYGYCSHTHQVFVALSVRMHHTATGLGLNFIDPYLQSVTSNFVQGTNFATAGATVQDVTYLSPITLTYQVKQFQEYHDNIQSVLNAGAGKNSPTF
jgi:hypothetical protein